MCTSSSELSINKQENITITTHRQMKDVGTDPINESLSDVSMQNETQKMSVGVKSGEELKSGTKALDSLLATKTLSVQTTTEKSGTSDVEGAKTETKEETEEEKKLNKVRTYALNIAKAFLEKWIKKLEKGVPARPLKITINGIAGLSNATVVAAMTIRGFIMQKVSDGKIREALLNNVKFDLQTQNPEVSKDSKDEPIVDCDAEAMEHVDIKAVSKIAKDTDDLPIGMLGNSVDTSVFYSIEKNKDNVKSVSYINTSKLFLSDVEIPSMRMSEIISKYGNGLYFVDKEGKVETLSIKDARLKVDALKDVDNDKLAALTIVLDAWEKKHKDDKPDDLGKDNPGDDDSKVAIDLNGAMTDDKVKQQIATDSMIAQTIEDDQTKEAMDKKKKIEEQIATDSMIAQTIEDDQTKEAMSKKKEDADKKDNVEEATILREDSVVASINDVDDDDFVVLTEQDLLEPHEKPVTDKETAHEGVKYLKDLLNAKLRATERGTGKESNDDYAVLYKAVTELETLISDKDYKPYAAYKKGSEVLKAAATYMDNRKGVFSKPRLEAAKKRFELANTVADYAVKLTEFYDYETASSIAKEKEEDVSKELDKIKGRKTVEKTLYSMKKKAEGAAIAANRARLRQELAKKDAYDLGDAVELFMTEEEVNERREALRREEEKRRIESELAGLKPEERAQRIEDLKNGKVKMITKRKLRIGSTRGYYAAKNRLNRTIQAQMRFKSGQVVKTLLSSMGYQVDTKLLEKITTVLKSKLTTWAPEDLIEAVNKSILKNNSEQRMGCFKLDEAEVMLKPERVELLDRFMKNVYSRSQQINKDGKTERPCGLIIRDEKGEIEHESIVVDYNEQGIFIINDNGEKENVGTIDELTSQGKTLSIFTITKKKTQKDRDRELRELEQQAERDIAEQRANGPDAEYWRTMDAITEILSRPIN